MSSSRARVVLLDVEGTTTPIDFVYSTLFPFARERAKSFLEARGEEHDVRADAEALYAEREREPDAEAPAVGLGSTDSVARYVAWLMDRDRKSTALKSLQGKIWQEGYTAGLLTSVVFDDVPRALARWSQAGRRIAIYSSGSVLAQKLLFAHTGHGDLTLRIGEYFDTNVGPKTTAASYAAISRRLGCAPSEILFLSDAPAELDAAIEAGLAVTLVVRPGNRAVHSLLDVPVATTFDDVLPDRD